MNGREVGRGSKLLTDSAKKLPTWRKGVSKIRKKLLTLFVDGPKSKGKEI